MHSTIGFKNRNQSVSSFIKLKLTREGFSSPPLIKIINYVRIDRLKIKWRNENLRIELKMNILDYVNSNENISITNLADYTNQEYLLVAAVVDELMDEGLIPFKSSVNNTPFHGKNRQYLLGGQMILPLNSPLLPCTSVYVSNSFFGFYIKLINFTLY